MSTARARINSRPPTAIVPFPTVLLDGDEGSGKTWEAMRLTTSPRVGDAFWLDLSEGAGDEYAAVVFCANCTDNVFDLDGRLVHKHDWSPRCQGGKGTVAEPGARPQYEVLRHDGTYASILGQVEAVWDYAREQHAAGEKPVVLIGDTMSTFYSGLQDWGTGRMLTRLEAKGKRPGIDQEIKNDPDIWNDINARYRRVMTKFLTMPGIVILTARGKEVTEFRDGAIVAGSKVWKTEGEKNMAYDVTVNVRMRREEGPLLVKARSPYIGTQPGVDDPKPLTNFSLDWLIFDAMRVNPEVAHVRDLHDVSGEGPMAGFEQEAIRARQAEETARQEAQAATARPAQAAPGRSAARRQAPAQQRPQPAQQAAQQPVQPDLPHVLPTSATAEEAHRLLVEEVGILAEIMGSDSEAVSKRWREANGVTLADASPRALLTLVGNLRPSALNRLATDGREAEAVALGRYVKVLSPIDLRAILDEAKAAGEVAPAA